MSTTATLTAKPSNQLWGIYYTDREYAREWAYCCRTSVIDPAGSYVRCLAVQFIQFFKDLFELPAFQEVALAVEKHRWQEQMRILRVQAEGPDL
jgi:hypothetical protein